MADDDVADRAAALRSLAKEGSAALPAMQELLKLDPATVPTEVVYVIDLKNQRGAIRTFHQLLISSTEYTDVRSALLHSAVAPAPEKGRKP